MSPVLSHYLVFMIGGLFGFVIFAIMDVAKSSDDISDEEMTRLIANMEKIEKENGDE